MSRIAKCVSLLSITLFSIFALVTVSYGQASNTWLSAGQLTQARTGAAAVLLQDGRILITGGSDSNGVPQASTEIFDPTTGQFSPAASMNVARANHAAIVLNTGDVLVTGGVTDPGGDYTNSAEIFSAGTQQWTQLQATLPQGLTGHAMALLADGNVLIAGGQSTTGPISTLLLFNATDNSITSVGTLMTARTNAAAAATPDGRVLIAGGADINKNVLASTEIFIYSPATLTGTISAGPAMTYARTAATATATYDGVAVIGGYNMQNGTQTDLGTAEIFSQWTNAFRVVSGATPRSGHFAVRLPNNGAILAMGGTGAQAVDLLEPWANGTAGAFVAASSSLSNQTGGFVSPATLGSILAAGGQGSSAASAELYWFPTIATDQADYPPGTPVVMTGTGFQPGETVDLHLHEWVNQTVTDLPDYTVLTGSNGTFSFTGYAPTTTDLGARYHLTAIGETSALQAQTIFTDGSDTTNVTVTCTPNPVPAGGSTTCTAEVDDTATGAPSGYPQGTVVFSLLTGTGTWSPSNTCSLTQISGAKSNCSETLTPTAAGTVKVQYNANPNDWKNGNSTTAFTIAAKQNQTITFVSPAPSSAPYGSTFNVAATASSGLTVTLSVDAASTSVCMLAGNTVTMTSATGSCTIVANQAGNSSYNAAPQVQTSATATKATLTASIIGNPTKPYDGNATATLTSTNFSLSGLVGTDSFTVNQTAGTYNSANVATATTVTANLSAANFTAVGSTIASNYNLPTTASGPGSITAVTLTASIIGNPTKPYDGNATATLSSGNFSLSGLVGTDSFTVTQTAGTYNSPNVASATTVTANLSAANFTAVGSTIASNYNLPTTASGPGSITAVTLTASIIGNPTKPYDGNATAALTSANFSLSGLVGTDSFTVTQTAGAYNSPNVASATTVTASLSAANFTPNGSTLATNYNLPTTASGPGSITPAPITATLTANNKTYDGNPTEPNGNMSCSLAGVLQNDVPNVSCIATAGSFSSQHVGTWTVSATVSIGGSMAGNYTLGASGTAVSSTPATASASISPAPVTATAGNYTSTFDGVSHSPTTCQVTGAYVGALTCSNSPSAVGPHVSSGAVTPTVNYNSDQSTDYTVTPVNGSYSITPAPVTVTAGSYSGVYDGSSHSPAACTVTGTYVGALTCTDNPSSVGPGAGSGLVSPTVNYNSSDLSTDYSVTTVNGSWNISKAQPSFSNLTPSQTITFHTSSIILSGLISAPGPAAPPSNPIYPSGQTVVVTINGVTAQGTIGANGAFNVTFNPQSIPVSASAYTITYSYAGDSNFLPAANANTTLTVHYAMAGMCDGDFGHQILQPIDPLGTSVFKSTSTSPAKFRVCDANGVSIGTPGVVSSFVLAGVKTGTVTAANDTVDSTTPDSAFRWDPTGQQWIYNISNKGLSSTWGSNNTFVFLITLNDGSQITFQYGLR